MLTHIMTLTLLIAAVLLLRGFFRKSVSPRLMYALWLAVVLKLVIPVPLLEVTFPEFPAKQETVNNNVNTAKTQSITDEDSATSDTAQAPAQQTTSITDIYAPTAPSSPATAQPDISVPAPLEEPSTTVYWKQILNMLWAAGAVTSAIIFIAAGVIFTVKVRRDRTYLCKVKGTRVYVCENAGGSCLAGLIPSIYLTPEAAYSKDATLVMAHEYTHLRHGDYLWSAIRTLALIVYWWNPLVWAAAIVSKQDAELACDYAIIKKLSNNSRMSYARIIINTIPQKRSFAVGLGNGEIKERIMMITKGQTNRIVSAVLAVIICLFAVGCSFIGGKNGTDLPDNIVYSEGLYIKTLGGTDMIIIDGKSPCKITASEGVSFEGLSDGDRIRIGVTELLDSWPMRAKVYYVEKLSEGSLYDIDADILTNLADNGWLEYEKIIDEKLPSPLSIPYVAYIKDAATENIDIYTAKDGDYIASIPYAVIEQFPAADRTNEAFPFGWHEQFKIYYGTINNFVWVVVATDSNMGTGNHNVCTSTDGGKTWFVGDRYSMYSGTVTGAGFASEKIGFMSYRYFNDNGPEIAWTKDGGKTWERMNIDIPESLKEYKMTPLVPTFNGENGTYPIQLYSENGADDIVNLVTADNGMTWKWDIDDASETGDSGELLNKQLADSKEIESLLSKQEKWYYFHSFGYPAGILMHEVSFETKSGKLSWDIGYVESEYQYHFSGAYTINGGVISVNMTDSKTGDTAKTSFTVSEGNGAMYINITSSDHKGFNDLVNAKMLFDGDGTRGVKLRDW